MDSDSDQDEYAAAYGSGVEPTAPIYLSTCPPLPATAPLDHPHLIDHTRFNDYILTQNLRLCDSVATTLWNFDQNAFAHFFDKNVNTFEWRNFAAEGDSFRSFVIRRQGSGVLAGMLYSSKNFLDWDWYIKSTIDNETGKWSATYAGSAGLTPVGPNGSIWNTYQSPPLHVLVAMQASDPADPRHGKYGGKRVARSLINMRAWDRRSSMWEGRDLFWTAQ